MYRKLNDLSFVSPFSPLKLKAFLPWTSRDKSDKKQFDYKKNNKKNQSFFEKTLNNYFIVLNCMYKRINKRGFNELGF